MSKNTFKVNQPKTNTAAKRPEVKGKSLFSLFDKYFNVNDLFERGVHIQYLPQILFTAFMLLIYIGISHSMEKRVRKIEKLQTEVEDLRADFTTLKAEYMHASMQSEVAKRLKEYGIEESVHPPQKIVVDK